MLLISWIIVKPQSNLVGFWIQIFATSTILVLISIVGIWIFPPWWMTYFYGLYLIVAIYIGLRKSKSFKDLYPRKIGERIILTAFILTFGYSINGILKSLNGWTPPEGEIIDLAFPLEKGNYIVANGGNDLSINAHMKTMDTTVSKYKVWRGNAFGLDLVKINKFGFRASGVQPSGADKYYIYGVKVLAPCDGEIIATCDGLPDMQVPEIDKANLAGNYVFLRGSKADILMAHFKQWSLKVKVGDRVKSGQVIGEVGNSGVSNEPHFHIHAQRPGMSNTPFSGDPLPLRLDGRFLVRNDRWRQ